jgi:hypothetical protein
LYGTAEACPDTKPNPVEISALFAINGLTALSRFSVRSKIDRGINGGSDGRHRYNSGTGARKLPQKGNANCQHVTLTVLFTDPIITMFGQL